MNIAYDAAHRIFKLDTDHTSYVIAVIDEEGFLCHAYYGDKISDTDVAYLLRTGEHPFVPSRNNRDRNAGIYVKGLLADGLYTGRRVPWGYPHARRNQRAGNLGRLPVPIDSYYNCG